MTEILVELILGLALGALISSLALGLVLNFRGAGVVNVGLGAVATLGAFLFYSLNVNGVLLFSGLGLGGPMAKLPALLITLLVCALLGILWDWFVLRALRNAPPVAKLVASLGLLLALQATLVLEFGDSGEIAPSVLPNVGSVSVSGQPLPASELVVAGLVVAVTLALAALYRWSRFGRCTRAASENEEAAMLNGLSPDRLSMTNTTMAFVLVGLLGVLVAPLASLDPQTMVVAIVPALAAALLARFTSFTVAALSGFAMGAIAALITYAQTKSWFPTSSGVVLPGTQDLIYVAILVAVICGVGKSIPGRGTLTESRLPKAPAARHIARPTVILLTLGAIAVIFLPFDYRTGLITSLIAALLCLSLVVTTGFVGQVSLAQLALAGVSAFVITKLAAHTGLGFPIVPLIGALTATAFGVLIGLPALRVRGVNLAIMTMAAAVAIESFGFQNATWGAGPSGSLVPEPTLLGLDIGPQASFGIGPGQVPSPAFGLVCLAVLAVVGVFVAMLRRSSLGHQMLAVRSNERAAAAAGIKVRDVKIFAFGISSFIAGLAGALYAYQLGSVTTDSFDIFVSFGFIAFAYVGGITTVSGALIGGIMATDGLGITVVKKVTGLPSSWALLFGGIALVITVIANPAGIAGATQEQIAGLKARHRHQTTPSPEPASAAAAAQASTGASPTDGARAAVDGQPGAETLEVKRV